MTILCVGISIGLKNQNNRCEDIIRTLEVGDKNLPYLPMSTVWTSTGKYGREYKWVLVVWCENPNAGFEMCWVYCTLFHWQKNFTNTVANLNQLAKKFHEAKGWLTKNNILLSS